MDRMQEAVGGHGPKRVCEAFSREWIWQLACTFDSSRAIARYRPWVASCLMCVCVCVCVCVRALRALSIRSDPSLQRSIHPHAVHGR